MEQRDRKKGPRRILSVSAKFRKIYGCDPARANFETVREKHLNEGSGYRRERMRVSLPAGSGRRWREVAVGREIIAYRERTHGGSERVETSPSTLSRTCNNGGIPFSRRADLPRSDSLGPRDVGPPENHIRRHINAYVHIRARMRTCWSNRAVVLDGWRG